MKCSHGINQVSKRQKEFEEENSVFQIDERIIIYKPPTPENNN